MTYILGPQDDSGDRAESRVVDDDSQELLIDILKELKKMNLQLAMITDTHFDEMGD